MAINNPLYIEITELTEVIFRSCVENNPNAHRFTIGEVLVLNRIALADMRGEPPMSVTFLSKQLGMPTPTVSKIVTKFTDHGLLSVTAHPGDGRKRQIVWSPEGREEIVKYNEIVARNIANL